MSEHVTQVEGIEDPPVTQEQIDQARAWVAALPGPVDVVAAKAYLSATQLQLRDKVREVEQLREALRVACATISEQQRGLDEGAKNFIALTVESLHIMRKLREEADQRVVRTCVDAGMIVGQA
jgi:hypothetical protein